MNFRMASSFTASLAKLTHQEAKAVKTAAFDLQMDPARPGLRFHRVERSRDPDFWTVRVNDDIRIVVHKRGEDFLLAWVGHHDDAYAWAERRRIDVHPATGAAQIVVVPETLEAEHSPAGRARIGDAGTTPRQRLFAPYDDETILACGVPEPWLTRVREADEDGLFEIAPHLPAEAAEALLNLAVGVRPPKPGPMGADPWTHPDAQRRFRLLSTEAELQAALDATWEAWTVFLHPAQRDFVDRDFNGPARVTGSAGTGKTVVALHRAAGRAGRDPAARVLLATFTDTLAAALRLKLRLLLGDDAPTSGRIAVRSMASLARELHEANVGPLRIASEDEVVAALVAAKQEHDAPFTPEFLLDEWLHVVDAWDIRDGDAYAAVPRLGRKTRVGGAQRDVLWSVMSTARARLELAGTTTWSGAWARVTAAIADAPPFDAAIVDEAQDLSVAELRFLAAIARAGGDLFFAGDIGQRIFRQPFSWRALGVDVRGRSRVLKVNYRTSHQIRARADRLLPGLVADGDGDEEDRRGVVSVFAGPEPDAFEAPDQAAETALVAAWLTDRLREGLEPGEIGLVVRTEDEAHRAEAACVEAGVPFRRDLPADGSMPAETVVCTMASAKGLEFRAVAVMACDEDVVPLAGRIALAANEAELREIYETERHLLYVACTRARERLLVSGVAPGSEFLRELARAGAG